MAILDGFLFFGSKTKTDTFAKGGKVSNTVNEIALKARLRPEAVAKFCAEHNIDDAGALEIIMALGEKRLPIADFVTAVIGNPNNEYVAEVLKYVKPKKADGGEVYDKNADLISYALAEEDGMDLELPTYPKPLTTFTTDAGRNTIYKVLSTTMKGGKFVKEPSYRINKDMKAYSKLKWVLEALSKQAFEDNFGKAKMATGGGVQTEDGKKVFNLKEIKSLSKEGYKQLFDANGRPYIYEYDKGLKGWVLYDAESIDKAPYLRRAGSHRMSKIKVNIVDAFVPSDKKKIKPRLLPASEYEKLFTMAKSTDGYTQEFADLYDKIVDMPDIELALKHFKTPSEFADYMLKKRPKGIFVFPKERLNKTEAEMRDFNETHRGYATGGAVAKVDMDMLQMDLKQVKSKYPKAKVTYTFAKDSSGKGYVITAKENSEVVYSSYKMATGGEVAADSFYALTSDGMHFLKGVPIYSVGFWKGKEHTHKPSEEILKEFVNQVPFDETMVINADQDGYGFGNLHSAFTPLYTNGARTVDAIIDSNEKVIWNKYAGSNYVLDVNKYKMATGGKVSPEFHPGDTVRAADKTGIVKSIYHSDEIYKVWVRFPNEDESVEFDAKDLQLEKRKEGQGFKEFYYPGEEVTWKDYISDQQQTGIVSGVFEGFSGTSVSIKEPHSARGEFELNPLEYGSLSKVKKNEGPHLGNSSAKIQVNGKAEKNKKIVVTKIADIPNFQENLKAGKITYRGLGMGKLANDFWKIAGTNGTRIKVDGKEYFITDTEFDTFSRGADGKMQIRFDAPYRKYATGGEIATEKDMAIINLGIIEEYAVKIDKIVDEETPLEDWVKMKLTEVEGGIAAIKHTLQGLDKLAQGGLIFKSQLLHIATYAKSLTEMIKGGTKLMPWMDAKLAVSAAIMDELFHHLDYAVAGNRAEDVKMAEGGEVANNFHPGDTVSYKDDKGQEQTGNVIKVYRSLDMNFADIKNEVTKKEDRIPIEAVALKYQTESNANRASYSPNDKVKWTRYQTDKTKTGLISSVFEDEGDTTIWIQDPKSDEEFELFPDEFETVEKVSSKRTFATGGEIASEKFFALSDDHILGFIWTFPILTIKTKKGGISSNISLQAIENFLSEVNEGQEIFIDTNPERSTYGKLHRGKPLFTNGAKPVDAIVDSEGKIIYKDPNRSIDLKKYKYATGGEIATEKDMAIINLSIIEEYAVKIDKIVSEETPLEDWVKMKLTEVEGGIAAIKHTLQGLDKLAQGGVIFKSQLLHIAKYAKSLTEMIKGGTKLMPWMDAKLAVCADIMDELFHHLDYAVAGNRAAEVKMAEGGPLSRHRQEVIKRKNLLKDLYSNEDSEVEYTDILKPGDVLFGDEFSKLGHVRIVGIDNRKEGDFFVLQDKFGFKFHKLIIPLVRAFRGRFAFLDKVGIAEDEFLYPEHIRELNRKIEHLEGVVYTYDKNWHNAQVHHGITHNNYLSAKRDLPELKEELRKEIGEYVDAKEKARQKQAA